MSCQGGVWGGKEVMGLKYLPSAWPMIGSWPIDPLRVGLLASHHPHPGSGPLRTRNPGRTSEFCTWCIWPCRIRSKAHPHSSTGGRKADGLGKLLAIILKVWLSQELCEVWSVSHLLILNWLTTNLFQGRELWWWWWDWSWRRHGAYCRPVPPTSTPTASK